jgi:uncharacterized protein (DUF302 family)
MTYNISRKASSDFNATVVRVKEALKGEGFGVLTEIDVAGTLKAKIGKDLRLIASSVPATRITPSRP